MNLEFEAFPKIGRLKRPITVTEKLDGTNAQIVVARVDLIEGNVDTDYSVPATVDGVDYLVMFASRSKYIKVGDDNYGFAAHFTPMAAKLAATLGEGRHFGEWWGKGIQRGYGQTQKQFSLFNTLRWGPDRRSLLDELGIGVVPTLYQGPMTETSAFIELLKRDGSFASLGYMDPEGIVVYHHATRTMFKQTIDKDEEPKGKQ